MILKVGITGGIGSGKTTVANVFSTLGIPVFDADAAAKNIMNEDPALIKNITKVFGEAAYKDGKLDRKYLAAIVFNDAEKLQQLNALVHPATIAAAEKWMHLQTTPYALKEAALMFESASAAGIDFMIGVYAPQHLRIQRAMARDNISRQEVINRMNKQIDEEIKMRLCDAVIINDEQTLVIPQVLKLHENLLALAASKAAAAH
jgi:dephospho-CoA kinase